MNLDTNLYSTSGSTPSPIFPVPNVPTLVAPVQTPQFSLSQSTGSPSGSPPISQEETVPVSEFEEEEVGNIIRRPGKRKISYMKRTPSTYNEATTPNLLKVLYDQAIEKTPNMISKTIRSVCSVNLQQQINEKNDPTFVVNRPVFVCGLLSNNNKTLMLQLHDIETSDMNSLNEVRIKTLEVDVDDAIECIVNRGLNCKKRFPKTLTENELRILDTYLQSISNVAHIPTVKDRVWFEFEYPHTRGTLLIQCLFNTLYSFVSPNPTNKILVTFLVKNKPESAMGTQAQSVKPQKSFEVSVDAILEATINRQMMMRDTSTYRLITSKGSYDTLDKFIIAEVYTSIPTESKFKKPVKRTSEDDMETK